MNVKTVVFLGSKPVGYQCFEYLLNQQSTLGYRVIGLLTQKRAEFSGNADLAALAAEAGVPVLENPDEIPECDLLYSVQYHRILSGNQLAKARLALNLHMAPLPEYRGANQFSFALMDGKKEFGTTIHLMDTRIDHGDIVAEKRFPIPENCWVETLYSRTEAASVALFKETLPAIISGNFQPLPQQALEAERGTALHFKNEMAALKEVPENAGAETVLKTLRATYMPGFEPPFLRTPDGEKIYLVREKDWIHHKDEGTKAGAFAQHQTPPNT